MDEFYVTSVYDDQTYAFHGRQLAKARGAPEFDGTAGDPGMDGQIGVPEAAVYAMGDGSELLFTYDEAAENADMADLLAPADTAWQAALRRTVTFAVVLPRADVTAGWLGRIEDDWGVPMGMLVDLWNKVEV